MRVSFVIASMRCGGAERVTSIMANYWAAMGWEISIITLDGVAKHDFYTLDSRVRRMDLGIRWQAGKWLSTAANSVTINHRLRQLLGTVRPHVVISLIDRTNVRTLMATLGLRISVIVCERIDPAQSALGKGWNVLRRWTYPLADHVVVQTQTAADFFHPRLTRRLRVIANPILPPADACDGEALAVPPCSVVAAGRFTVQKGFDVLLKAFARVAGRHPIWHLVIVGDGELRSVLEKLVVELGLYERVLMPGNLRGLGPILRQAEIFVLSSRFEGFPNVLCEAMACGRAVVSTDCPSGPQEIIRNGMDGLLVPPDDVEALAVAMDRLMSDTRLRADLGARATTVTERFSLSRIMAEWEMLIANLVGNRTR